MCEYVKAFDFKDEVVRFNFSYFFERVIKLRLNVSFQTNDATI